ncbi:MAG: hypothetical protein KIT58_12230 [Planctomycetota bacterium]|nr:hypothetical protein [Planctomycetota bacterium]
MIGLLIVSMWLSGCGSILFPTHQVVQFECTNVGSAGFSAPAAGAGCRSGQVMRLDRTKDHVIEVRADGYEPQTLKLVSEVSAWRVAVSIILNGLVSTPTLWIATPFLCGVDIRSGAWKVLEPGEVLTELHRPGQGPSSGEPSASTWPTATPSPAGFCNSCGARLSGTRFCTGCGARVQ